MPTTADPSNPAPAATTDRGFPQPGDTAVILTTTPGGTRLEHVTVDRVLKRDVVLDNGDRFNRHRLTRHAGSTWGGSQYLLPPDDDRVVHARSLIAANRHRAAVREQAETISVAIKRRQDDWQATARAAAQAILQLLDEPSSATSTDGGSGRG